MAIWPNNKVMLRIVGVFIRVYRSFIVPAGKIEVVTGNSIKVNDAEIPINKIQREKLIEDFRQKGILGDRSVVVG